MQHIPPVRGWNALLHQWLKDIQLWLYILVTLELFRPLLIITYNDAGANWSWVELGHVMLAGLRFDVSTAAMWVLPTFLLSLGVLLLPLGHWLERLRLGVGYVYAAAAMFAFGADLVYFGEYNDQFDQRIFGLFHDDTTAILITIWRHYHPIPVLLAVGVLVYFNIRLLRRWLAYTPQPFVVHIISIGSLLRRTGATLALFLFTVAMARGGTLWGDTIGIKHAFVANDLFLNRTVANPLSALAQAIEVKWRAEHGAGLASFWPENNLSEAVALVRSRQGEHGPYSGNLDIDLSRQAHGAATPPRHIFVLLLESHSGWPVLPAYRQYGFSPRIADLADRGIYFPNFMPSSSGTIGSLNAMVTGMPDCGLNINYEPSASQAYASAIASNFQKLGYRTRFFYGGYLGWQRLDRFTLAQGFDEVQGGGSMLKKGQSGNEWGAADEILLNHVLETVDDTQPSFNLILSTSNHPPYDIDLKAAGFPLTAMPEPLVERKEGTLHVLGHLWYTDQQVGRFVAAAEKKLPHTLFAITGDHTTRSNIGFPGDSVAEQVVVPFVLYGPDVLGKRSGLQTMPGAHIDIAPTLYELAAPAGFRYTAFGRDLLSQPAQEFGLGHEYFIGTDYIAPYRNNGSAYALPGVPNNTTTAPAAAALREYNALRALAWYRIRRGVELPIVASR